MKAKRGDLIVVERETSSTRAADYSVTSTRRFEVGVVTNITRDGTSR